MSQSFNSDAFKSSFDVIFHNPQLAIPHFTITSIAEISPHYLFQQGIRGVIFDKDNTITAPYINSIFPSLIPVVDDFRSVFGDNMKILSNSAGTKDDTNYNDAQEIESTLNIEVIRHSRKKPEGYQDVEKWFNISTDQIIMIGDRILTDTLFGNRAGLLTIHTDILTLKGDNIPASIARFFENKMLKRWKKKGYRAPVHPMQSISLSPD